MTTKTEIQRARRILDNIIRKGATNVKGWENIADADVLLSKAEREN